MRQIVLVSGVLGGGSAVVFALAAVVATLFPNGTLVAANPWNSQLNRAMPAMGAPFVVDDSGSGSSGTIVTTVGTEIAVPTDMPVASPAG